MTNLELIYKRMYPEAHHVIAKRNAGVAEDVYLAKDEQTAMQLASGLVHERFTTTIERL